MRKYGSLFGLGFDFFLNHPDHTVHKTQRVLKIMSLKKFFWRVFVILVHCAWLFVRDSKSPSVGSHWQVWRICLEDWHGVRESCFHKYWAWLGPTWKRYWMRIILAKSVWHFLVIFGCFHTFLNVLNEVTNVVGSITQSLWATHIRIPCESDRASLV